ncbi:DedA family protein [Amycolatopsis sp. 195334CR]|uniref:DedA family protein n=1 Tax=Amycolatopsis sp. 195334CR TaxID=2814588 RepID=UPI001A90C063|nr:VTT domain-containing protein [Amycolatopsis sp. 195334CR]MBN6039763.1 VTT domain-containing protein [Amycolatopsis sp. 195334CR]
MFEMLDSVVDGLREAVDSPWPWVLVFVLSAANALIPFLPSRTAVVTVAVLVAAHPERLALLTVLAAAGALAGDCAGYWIGRRVRPGVLARLQRGERARRWSERARRAAHRHAPALIVAGRHLPGGRITGAIAPGSISYPWRRFLVLDLIGTTLWAGYCTAVGYLGGASFADDPVKGLLVGFGIALVVPLVTELIRRRLSRREPAPDRGAHQ